MHDRKAPPREELSDASEYIRLKELARASADAVPPDDTLVDAEATAAAMESALFTTLDLVAAVRVAPEPPQAARTLTGELELAGSHGAMTLLLLLQKLGGMPFLRDMAGKAIKSMAGRGVRSRSESVVVSLTEPEPAGAWKLADEGGEIAALWYAHAGQDGGARLLSVTVEGGRATSAVLDCLPAAEGVETRISESLPEESPEPAPVEWNEARELLAGVWSIHGASEGGVDEATYLRPWVERSILRGIKPHGPPPSDEAAETPGNEIPPLAGKALNTLGASPEDREIARHVCADFTASFEGEVPEDQLDEWAAATVLAVVNLSSANWSQAEVARACGVSEDDLMEAHEEFWEIMAVDVAEDEGNDEADQLLDILPPKKTPGE